MSEQYSTDLRERIDRKMESMGEKREAQLQSVQERIREHVRLFSVISVKLAMWVTEETGKPLLSVCL